VTAIHEGDGIAANAPFVDKAWTPEVNPTPVHPEYPSGESAAVT
jgi:hypothetical protein